MKRVKNTLLIVIDSLYYDKTIAQPYRHNPMPFLSKLRSEGLDCTRMYSEAPYTEAALISLLAGMDTLKGGGYIKRFYNKKTIMEIFKESGYDTFCNAVQPFAYPTCAYPGLTDEYYNTCYKFSSLWSTRLSFYSDKYKNGELNDKDLNLVLDLLENNLNFWPKFFQQLKNKDKKVSFILPFINIDDLDENIQKLNVECERFQKDKLSYLKELLTLGKNHPLHQIKQYSLSEKLSYQDMQKIYKKYKKIVRKMFLKNLTHNLKNNQLVLTPREERKSLFKNYLNSIVNRFMMQKINPKIKEKKSAPSMDTTFEHFESWLKNRKSKKPYFAYIHVDDCHSPEIFYTYDTNDFKKLDQEFESIEKYINNIPKNYKGNLSYDVSLQYADICLKRLFTFLEENNMLDNLNIAICADHGSSYSFAPYRSNFVNNVHRENYNMPFILWSKSLKHQKITGFHNTKDIAATLLDVNNLKIPKEYDGISILNNHDRDYVLLENVNGGCPDYNKRDFLLGIRNERYCIVMNLNIHKEFKDGSFYAIYDLINDKDELYNLKNDIDENKIKKELEILKKEFNNLKKDVKKYNFINN